jgi:hypothetical protein
MLTYADLVGELSTTEGIGTFTLTGPMDGGRSFLAGAGEGAYVSYRASNLSNPNAPGRFQAQHCRASL